MSFLARRTSVSRRSGGDYRPIVTVAALCVLLSSWSGLSAQDAATSSLFRIEVLKPDFKQTDYSLATTAMFVTIRESVEGPVAVEIQVPLAFVGEDGETGSDWEFRPGNPYFGLSWTSLENPATLGFGFSVPILPNDADARIMQVADMHRYEAFAPDLWSFSVHSVVGGDVDPIQGKSSTSLWIPLHGSIELVTNYSLNVRRPVANLLLGLQVRGRAGITGDHLVFGERTMHEAGMTLEFVGGGFRPGIQVRRPIQGREMVDWVFGVTASFN